MAESGEAEIFANDFTSSVSTEYKAKVLVRGIFDRDQIDVTTTDHRITLDEDQKEKINKAWEPFATKGFFPGPLVRVETFGLSEDGKLKIVFGKTDYKEFVGTRDRASRLRYGYDCISNPLTTSSVIFTSDRKLLFAKRGNFVDQPGDIDAIGGHIDPNQDLDKKGNIDIFKAAIREVSEEARVQENEIVDVKCLGLTYEYRSLSHVSASFAMRTQLTSHEILPRKSEEIEIIVADLDKKSGVADETYVMNILRENYPHVEPEALVTIALARKWIMSDPHILVKKLYRSKVDI